MRNMLYGVLGVLVVLTALGACNRTPRSAQTETQHESAAEVEVTANADDPASWTPAPENQQRTHSLPDEKFTPPAIKGQPPPRTRLQRLDLPMVDFAFKTFDGSTLRLSDYKGKPLVLNFWADWCPPCMAEMPHFAEVYSSRAGQFELVSITDDSSRDPAAFVGKGGFDWVFGVSNDAPGAYELQAWPTTVFIDRDGVIRHIVKGAIDVQGFEERLRLIL